MKMVYGDKNGSGNVYKISMSDILNVSEAHRLEWHRHVVRIAVERTVKKLLESKPGGGRKKGRPVIKVDGWCQIGLDGCGCGNVENKSFGQNRMGICHEGRQGQTWKVVVLKKKQIFPHPLFS